MRHHQRIDNLKNKSKYRFPSNQENKFSYPLGQRKLMNNQRKYERKSQKILKYQMRTIQQQINNQCSIQGRLNFQQFYRSSFNSEYQYYTNLWNQDKIQSSFYQMQCYQNQYDIFHHNYNQNLNQLNKFSSISILNFLDQFQLQQQQEAYNFSKRNNQSRSK